MKIGTAAPTKSELDAVPHHFVGHLSVQDDYSAGVFESEAIDRINGLFEKHQVAVLSGGSGLYVKAVTHGLDEHPSDLEVRNKLIAEYGQKGLEYLQQKLLALDPATYRRIDRQNHQRIIRALEVCIVSGKPYSSFLTRTAKDRNFTTVGVGLSLPRERLVERINQRVDQMVANGLVEEARRLYPIRNLNALQTVGYQELFAAFDGKVTKAEAIEAIKTNTRKFAKRQMTWFKKHIDAEWFSPDQYAEIEAYLQARMAPSSEA